MESPQSIGHRWKKSAYLGSNWECEACGQRMYNPDKPGAHWTFRRPVNMKEVPLDCGALIAWKIHSQ